MLFVEAGIDFLELKFFLQLFQFFFQLLDFLGLRFLLAFEIGALSEIELGEQLGDSFVAQTLIYLVEKSEVFLKLGHEPRHGGAFELGGAFAIAHGNAVCRAL